MYEAMRKHAYLIICHKYDEALQYLLRSIDDERNDIFIHVDAKASDFDFTGLKSLLRNSDVFFTDSRLRGPGPGKKAYSTFSLVRHRDSDALKSEQRLTLSKLLGAFAMALLFNVLACARTGAWYIGRQDVLVDVLFFALLSVFTLASYAFASSEKIRGSYLILGVALLLNVLAFVRFNPSFYAPTNSGGLSAEQCVQIDEDIVHQITEAVSENQSRMDLKVPDFGSSDKWPLAIYAGGPYSRSAYTLWRHGLIQKSISINVVPDQAKNADFGF